MFYMIRSVVDMCLFVCVKSTCSTKVGAISAFFIKNVREKLLIVRRMSDRNQGNPSGLFGGHPGYAMHVSFNILWKRELFTYHLQFAELGCNI